MSSHKMPASVKTAGDAALVHDAAAGVTAELNMSLLASLKAYKKACFWSMLLSTCVIMEGFDLVLLNNLYAYPPFQRRFGELQPDGSYQLTADWQSGLSGGNQAAQIIGLFITGVVVDRYGYRRCLVGALLAVTAFIFIIFFAGSLPQLLAGEILIAIPWGLFQTSTTTYASEVCPTHLRAYLTTYINACWVIGQLIASGVLRAMLTRDDEWGYRIPFALQWMWPVPLMVAILLAPESPWWLVRHGRIEDAKAALRRLTDETGGRDAAVNVNDAVAVIVHTNEMERKEQEGMTYAHLFKRGNLRRTEVVCITMMIQGATGSTLMGYSTYFYQQAGMSVDNSFNMTIAGYAIGLGGTLVAWFLMGRFGRRTLYLSGQILAGIALLATGCTALAERDNVAAQWAIGSLLMVHTLVYDSSIGPVCYSLVSELSSTRLRTKSVVVARNLYSCVCIVTSVLTPRMLNPSAWNWGAKTGFLWAGMCLLASIWTYFRLPEPKGRTYAELEILFEQGISARNFSSAVLEPLDAHLSIEAVQGRSKSLDA